jgi:hypothetical protein
MRSSVTSRVSINARSEEVFKYLSDSNYHFLWNPHLQSLTPMTKLKKDASYETVSLLLGVKVSAKNLVTKLTANKELQIENTTGSLKYKVNYRLVANSKLTVLICNTEVTADGNSFAFTLPILKLLARHELQSDLKSLKLAVEQKLG